MSSSFQTIIAFAVVTLAVTLLVRSWFLHRKHPGCGANCGAVSPEVRRLQAKLKR